MRPDGTGPFALLLNDGPPNFPLFSKLDEYVDTDDASAVAVRIGELGT